MKKVLLLLAIVVVLLSNSVFPSTMLAVGNKTADADLVIENAYIYTVDENKSVAEAIAIKDGVFIYVGDNKGVRKYIGPKTEVIDLKGKMLTPGFGDGHLHAYLYAEKMFWLDLSKYRTYEQYEEAIKTYLEANPDMEQFRAAAFNEAVVQEASAKLGLSPRALIDRLVSDIPFVAVSGGHHEIWVNSAAIENAGLDKNTPNPQGGTIDRDPVTGELTGIFREFASQSLIVNKLPVPDFTVEEYKEALLAFQEEAAQYGLTSIFMPIHYPTTTLLEAFEELDNEGKLTLTYDIGLWADEVQGVSQVASFVELRDQYNGEHYTIGTIKVFATGDTEEATPLTTGDNGLVWKQDVLNETLTALDREGFRVHAHANGDGQGVTAMLEAVAYARKQNGDTGVRHAITHIPMVTEEHLKLFKELNVVAVPQPSWFFRTKGVPAGDARLQNLNRMNSYFEKGVTVSSSSDFPVVGFNPLEGVETGITRVHWTEDDTSLALWKQESSTVEQMLTSYTNNVAYQNGLENTTGSIEVGKNANFTVLDQNLFEVPVTEISDVKFLLTYFEGQEVYRNASIIDSQYIENLVDELYEDNQISNKGAYKSLKAQLKKVKAFENQNNAKEVIKSVELFENKLVKYNEKSFISKESYATLQTAAEAIITNWN